LHEQTPEKQVKKLEHQEHQRQQKLDNSERNMNYELNAKTPSNTKKPKSLEYRSSTNEQRREIQNTTRGDDEWIVVRRKK
jgi:hypothetical protein